MSYTIYIFLITNLIIILLFKSSKYFDFLLDDVKNDVRQIHSKKMIKFGGLVYLTLFINLYNLENYFILKLLLFSFSFLIVGVIADINKKFNAYQRLFLSTVIVIIFLSVADLKVSYVNIDLIDIFFSNYLWLSIFFTCLGILFYINGSNLIDGQHGLLLGSSIIALLNLYLLTNYDIETGLLIRNIILITIILFFYNFISGKIKSGDNGAYFLGFIISGLSVYIYENYTIDPFLIATILAYPVFEAIFSYLRRVLFKRNPFEPDELHLHSNIFKILKKIFLNVHSETANKLTSLLILFVQTIFWIPVYYYNPDINYEIVFFAFIALYLILYLSSYLFLKRLSKSA